MIAIKQVGSIWRIEIKEELEFEEYDVDMKGVLDKLIKIKEEYAHVSGHIGENNGRKEM